MKILSIISLSISRSMGLSCILQRRREKTTYLILLKGFHCLSCHSTMCKMQILHTLSSLFKQTDDVLLSFCLLLRVSSCGCRAKLILMLHAKPSLNNPNHFCPYLCMFTESFNLINFCLLIHSFIWTQFSSDDAKRSCMISWINFVSYMISMNAVVVATQSKTPHHSQQNMWWSLHVLCLFPATMRRT